MVYELRIYEVMPGKMEALSKRFHDVTGRYFRKYGITEVGYWTALAGTTAEFVYILAYENLATREKAWDGFIKDAERKREFSETDKDGVMVWKSRSMFLTPTAYSALK
jgi:hypothetical protein